MDFHYIELQSTFHKSYVKTVAEMGCRGERVANQPNLPTWMEEIVPTPRIQSVDRAFSLLSHLARSGGCQSLPNMALGCGLTNATAHRLLTTLEALGAVIHTGPGEYRIGLGLIELAGNASRDNLLAAAAEPVLRTIVRTLGHTAHIGVLDQDCMVTYIAKMGRPAHCLPTRIGCQLEAYCSGLGKVLLASMPLHVQEVYIADGPFVALTKNTIIEAEHLRRELEQVSRQGYAVDDREIFDELRCVAVPIFGRQGQVIAAMSTSAQASELKRSDVPEVARQMQAFASRISGKLYPPQPIRSCRKH